MTSARKVEQAIKRIEKGAPRPAKLCPPPSPTSVGARDLDAPDELIVTGCGRQIERRAGRMRRSLIDPETGEVCEVEQRTREYTYTLWEPRGPGASYRDLRIIAGTAWGAAHTRRWDGEPVNIAAVGKPPILVTGDRAPSAWEMRQQARAMAVIRATCRELGNLDGVGGAVYESRGEVLLSGSVGIRYAHAMAGRRPT